MTAPLFYAESVPESGLLTIGGEEGRHAVKVMRLTPGQTVLASDGNGALAQCTVVGAEREKGLLVEVHERHQVPAPRQVDVLQAIPKSDRAEIAVELMTETGVSRIIPWSSARTVADWRGKTEAKTARWQRVAHAAGKQSRRAHLPTIGSLVSSAPEPEGSVLVLHEQAGESLFTCEIPDGPLTVVVGPEGGLTEHEVQTLVGQGARLVNLGPTILRTSTAGAAACVWIRGFEISRGACHDR